MAHRSNLNSFDQSTGVQIMNELHIIARVAQGLLAVSMTVATGLIFFG
jgi:hypothetical protein